MKRIQFGVFTLREQAAVGCIIERARGLYEKLGLFVPTRLELYMDLSAVNAEMPLRLEELAGADDANFSHDIGGIRQHLNRITGKLGDCFVPRFTR